MLDDPMTQGKGGEQLEEQRSLLSQDWPLRWLTSWEDSR